MTKNKIQYQCQACGYISAKWLGKCPDCGGWNTMVEEMKIVSVRGLIKKAMPQPLSSITAGNEKRTTTGIREFDRVLGGGVVEGSVVLVGGDPGIGKSTLLIQAASNLRTKGNVLYVSGEESPEQIKLRASRLQINSDDILLLPETNLEGIINAITDLNPSVVIIDSIQTIFTEEIPSAPGSVGQVRECAARLASFAKKTSTPLFIIGHVTKDGAIAGPRVLEHIVDTVLYFEGDRGHSYRILRTVKNRFGSTNEIGVFEMTEAGLIEINNPSGLFLSERPSDATGSVVVSSIEGTRPILVELQALVSPTTFGMPRRTCMGVDFNRVNLLIAVLEKVGGLHLGGMDVFVNVVGGLKIVEPAVDLGIVAAITSSFREIPFDPETVVFGEIGLSGEIRGVSQLDARLREAEKVGFKRVIMPETNLMRLNDTSALHTTGVRNIHEFLEVMFH
ncbi:MAG: DNA repair protein RadA [Thermodesulfovibrionales bacterium]